MEIILKLYKNGNFDKDTFIKFIKIYKKYNKIREDGLLSAITGRKRGAQPGNQNRKGTGKGGLGGVGAGGVAPPSPPSPTTTTQGLKPIKPVKPAKTPNMPNSDRPLGEINEEKSLTYKMNRKTPQQNMGRILEHANKETSSVRDIAQSQRDMMEQFRKNAEMLKKINGKSSA